MADLTFILTTAGFNALVNPANTGTNAITVDRIGVSSVVLPGTPDSNVGIVQLPNELKRLASFGGDVVGDNTIHVTIRDESPDVYQLRTFGLYSAGGVLLAFYTQPTPIMEKAASSMLLLAADLQFTTPISAELVFGDTNFINPPATSERQGVVELATAAETATGTDATRAVTPFGLKSLLTALLAGFSQIGHTHAAGDVTSGTFAIARIPDIAQAKVTGLVDALLGKAAAVHGHTMSEVTGLVAALSARLIIADFTWQNLVGKPNVAVQGFDAVFQDLRLTRSAAPTTGALFLGDQTAGGRYLYWTGSFYELPGAPLISNGHAVWTAGNFNPATKQNALGFTPLDRAGGTMTGPLHIDTGGLRVEIASGGLEVTRPDGLGFIDFKTEAGEDFDVRLQQSGSDLAIYGGSLRIGSQPVWHSGNFSPATKATLGQDVVFQDITCNRGNGTGVLFLTPPANGRYLFYDGAAYDMPGAPLRSNGHFVWTAGNFDPGTKSNVGHGHSWAEIASKPAWTDPAAAASNTGHKSFVVGGNADIANGTTVGASLEVTGAGGGAAFMGFHRPGLFATFLGVDTDNQLKFGGWSQGTVAHRIWHDGNSPAGVVQYLACASVPAGMRALVANGAEVSRATYARLFDAIGTTYGAGNGATTFNLPDLRGVFLRGLDNGRGIDPGRGLNSLQMSQNLSHRHSIDARSSTGSNNGYVEDGDNDGIVRSMFSGFEGGSEARPTNEALLAVITY